MIHTRRIFLSPLYPAWLFVVILSCIYDVLIAQEPAVLLAGSMYEL